MTSATVDVDSAYPLTSAHVEALDRQGFVRLSNLLSPPTVAHFEPTITERVLALNAMHLPMDERDTYDRAFLQVTNLWQHDDRVRRLVFSPRLARAAAELLGVDAVRLYHDQALYKEPGGGITPWHADQYYWPFASDRTITVWIPLQDTPRELGSLEFARGSHHFSHGRDLPIGDESEQALQEELAARGFEVDSAPYALGDASFHLGWTFHRAGPNRSTTPRRVMTIIYVDADAVVSEPVNDSQRNDLTTWLGGTAVGSVPETELNPVLYRA
ncbi:phytanoyl-CoA dioxygenase family protein [Labedaea rhizosphaerae]|uniref:Ectoine hydroxylase-related dioxygenase (Phytanoyl-CoA dioxygenase family) n=1 Tax=Labedaea rhizosphaerae TaxID=598644 RepID=A0A4R6S7P7_LABRH|nr:phytanoyl-CoA dioxygenase family protein [Labedaea rhizosphaerae]TDP94835.1 ectoine hydroxylase-related dioxygenase (phytanoyl-CoA dioxygenase family) [Labedaea rhizosphaerae]